MGFIDLLPMNLRISILYYRSFKISKSKKASVKEKIDKIYGLEKVLKGKSGFDIKKVGREQAIATSIGRVDMAKIFNSLSSPDDALRYLSEIDTFLLNYIKGEPTYETQSSIDRIFNKVEMDIPYDNSKKQTVFETLVLTLLYRCIAYSLRNEMECCKQLAKQINNIILNQIEMNPANKRLDDLYKYSVDKTYEVFINIGKSNPANRRIARDICLELLFAFDKNDPGNDFIQEYIQKLV